MDSCVVYAPFVSPTGSTVKDGDAQFLVYGALRSGAGKGSKYVPFLGCFDARITPNVSDLFDSYKVNIMKLLRLLLELLLSSAFRGRS